MPSKDRLGDFLARRPLGSGRGFKWQLHSRLRSESEGQLPDLPSSGKGRSEESQRTRWTEAFLAKVERVSLNVDRMEKELSDLKRLQNSTLASPLSSGQNDELYRALNTFRTSALDVRRQLKELDEEINLAKGASSTEKRICQTQRTSLNGKVSRLLTEFSQTQVGYRQRCVHRVQRQLFIVGQPAVSQEHIEELLSRDEPTMLFTQGVIANSQRAKEALRDIESRHGELLALEKSVTELRDLFKDIAMLIELQGETVTSIEQAVITTRDEIKDTGSLLKEARAMRKSARSKKRKLLCIGGVLLGILAVVIILVVYFTV